MLNTQIIGTKIAHARKKINLTQAQLARRLFISSQAVGKWERGESMPDITTFNRLAEVLGVDLNYFSDSSHTRSIDMAPVEATPVLSKRPGWNMSEGHWTDADFSWMKNLDKKFSSSNIQRCKFIGSDLSGLSLASNNIDACDFSGSNIGGASVSSSNVDNTLFKKSALIKTTFSNSHFKSCDFSGSDMSSSYFESSHLSSSLFKDCLLIDTEFLKSHIEGCNLSGADFTGSVFKSGGFGNNLLAKAVWKRTSFIGMHIEDIVFEGVLEDCYFENCVFKWVKFESSTLKNTFFKDNRLNGYRRIRFASCLVDRITYEFLKAAKADLTGITVQEERNFFV